MVGFLFFFLFLPFAAEAGSEFSGAGMPGKKCTLLKSKTLKHNQA